MATDGRDTNPGTKEQPLRSLEAARDEIRRRRAAGTLAGRCDRHRPRGYLPSASGVRAHPGRLRHGEHRVIYRGYPGEEARLSGGTRAAARSVPSGRRSGRAGTPDTPGAGRHVLQVDLGALGINDLGELGGLGGGIELFLGDRRLATRPLAERGLGARPLGNGLRRPRRAQADPTTGLRFKHEGSPPRSWASLDGVWLRGYWLQEYHFEAWQPRGFDPARREITLGQPLARTCGSGDGSTPSTCSRSSTGPASGISIGPARCSTSGRRSEFGREPLQVSLLAQPLVSLADVSLRHFARLHARGDAWPGGDRQRWSIKPDRRLRHPACPARSDPQRRPRQRGVRLRHPRHRGHRRAARRGRPPTLEPAGLYAENNHIHHYAQQLKTWQPGIRIEGVGNRVAHNLVHDAPQYAISYHGNDHLIEFNDLHSVCLEMSDVGVIGCGTDWTIRGNVIRHNFIHDIPERPYPGLPASTWTTARARPRSPGTCSTGRTRRSSSAVGATTSSTTTSSSTARCPCISTTADCGGITSDPAARCTTC